MATEPPEGDGLDAVRNAGAQPQAAPDLRDSGHGGGDAFDEAELGDDCPIEPLGQLGKVYHFLDFQGQHIELGSEFRKGELMQLFGTAMAWLDSKWPQWKLVPGTGVKEVPPKFELDGFSQKNAQRGLILACAKAGLFNPKGKVRGRGAHRGDHGELVLHCGELVLVGGARLGRKPLPPKSHRPGKVAGYVYPRLEKLPLPKDKPSATGTAIALVQMLDTWNWKDRATALIHKSDEAALQVRISPYLLLCWVAAATLGGALRNRPHVWIVGPSGAGKTTLQQLLRDVMDQWGVFCEDASEAGVRQLLDQDTLPVMFDEIEPDAENDQVHLKIVKLARLAYSGGEALRGSADHKAKSFVARSCFLFSSIHHHELPAQDRNRMAVLRLESFPPATAPLEVPEAVREWGGGLRRRLIEQWGRYDATREVYAREMLRQGYSGREQDTYGTLLAAGDLLLYDQAPDPSVAHEPNRAAELVHSLKALIDKARSEAESTVEQCLRRLTSHRLPAKSGEDQQTVGGWIERGLIEALTAPEEKRNRVKLKTHGMRLVNLDAKHAEGNGQGGMKELYLLGSGYLAVAGKNNQGMREIFDRSDWKNGVWMQTLAGVGGAFANKKHRFGGPPEQCVLVPLSELVDVETIERDAEAVARRLFEESQGGQS